MNKNKRFVISNIPIKLPFQSTILYTFLLYYFQVSGIFWGIFITIYTIYWIIAIIAKIMENKIDLNSTDLDEIDEKNKVIRAKFGQKLERMRKQKYGEF